MNSYTNNKKVIKALNKIGDVFEYLFKYQITYLVVMASLAATGYLVFYQSFLELIGKEKFSASQVESYEILQRFVGLLHCICGLLIVVAFIGSCTSLFDLRREIRAKKRAAKTAILSDHS